jgi:hypothetical protein
MDHLCIVSLVSTELYASNEFDGVAVIVMAFFREHVIIEKKVVCS